MTQYVTPLKNYESDFHKLVIGQKYEVISKTYNYEIDKYLITIKGSLKRDPNFICNWEAERFINVPLKSVESIEEWL